MSEALFQACESGDLKKVQNILSSGSFDLDYKKEIGTFNHQTALDKACSLGFENIVRELVITYQTESTKRIINPSLNEIYALQTFQTSAIKNWQSKINHRQDYLKKYFGRALMHATKGNHPKIVKLLLENGTDANFATEHEKSTALQEACSASLLEIIEILLEYGANIEQANLNGCTPLLAAVMLGLPEVVVRLIEKGANINAELPNGDTALQIACSHRHLEIAKELLKRDAVVDQSTLLFIKSYEVLSPINKELKYLEDRILNHVRTTNNSYFIDPTRSLKETSKNINITYDVKQYWRRITIKGLSNEVLNINMEINDNSIVYGKKFIEAVTESCLVAMLKIRSQSKTVAALQQRQ